MKSTNQSDPYNVAATRKLTATPTVEQFVNLVQIGVDAWTNAGRMLVEMVKNNPNIFSKIVQAAPWVSIDVLASFHRIGLGTLHPRVLLLKPRHAALVSTLPIEKQTQLIDNPDALAELKTTARYKRGLSTPMKLVSVYRPAAPVVLPPAVKSNMVSAGFYRVVMQFGRAVLTPIPKDVGLNKGGGVTRIVLSNSLGDDEAFVELLRTPKP